MKMRLFLTVVMGLAFTVSAQMAPKLVEVTDMMGNKGYEILDAEGVTELAKQIKEETKIFPVVLAEAKKKWAESDEFKKKHFPATAVKARKARVLVQGKEEALQKMKEKNEDRLAAAQERRRESQEEKYKKLSRRARDKDKIEKMREKDEEQDRLADAAGQLVAQLMAEKLGRSVPSYGTASFALEGAFGGGDKKDDKKDAKKDAKKDVKKDAKK